MVRPPCSVLFAAALLVLLRLPASSQVARSRISSYIDESRLERFPRNTHPLARPRFDQGMAPADLPLDRMLLVLIPSADRQQALAELLKSQQAKGSPQYHKWLTPQQYGQQFGAADADIQKITGWLQSQGFSIGHVANARNLIEFSGTAGQVQQAFHTEIHKYVVNGREHWANASDPQVPAALAPVVGGVSTLHNFQKASQVAALKPQVARISATGRPQFTLAPMVRTLSHPPISQPSTTSTRFMEVELRARAQRLRWLPGPTSIHRILSTFATHSGCRTTLRRLLSTASILAIWAAAMKRRPCSTLRGQVESRPLPRSNW